jgi:dTDP-4-amino-4,6-dideoxygalactose transaminase
MGVRRYSRPMAEDLIPLFDVRLSDDEIAAVADTLRSGWLTMGPRTQAFEAAFAAHLGCRHAVATSSCTTALHLAYLAAGIGPGDEVIVPAITFVASASAVRYCGGTPVPAEIVGQHDLGIDPGDVEARITERTKAVCAVHYAGYASAVTELRDLCDAHNIALIEDAAHSPSAVAAGDERKLGTYGLAGAFSFFSNKVLSCGEGGLLATDDDRVAGLARSLRSHAMTSGTWDRHRGHAAGYDVVALGFNYRIDEPRAALLTARLARLDAENARRRELDHRYRELLPEGVVPTAGPVLHIFTALVDDRDRVRAELKERGIQTSLHYPPAHRFAIYADGAPDLPLTDAYAAHAVTLPLFAGMSDTQQDAVIDALAAATASAQLRSAP